MPGDAPKPDTNGPFEDVSCAGSVVMGRDCTSQVLPSAIAHSVS